MCSDGGSSRAATGRVHAIRSVATTIAEQARAEVGNGRDLAEIESLVAALDRASGPPDPPAA